MSDAGALPPAEPATVFFVGHHDSALEEPHSLDVLSHAHELGYDFFITPITNPQFDTRVITQLKRSYDAISQDEESSTTPMPAISPLGPEDTTLTPNDGNVSFVAKVSPWIDLDSYDHVGFQVFRQVLNIEVAYAAFCGINNIILHAPKSYGNVVQFARAVREALGLGPYVHVHILFQMTDTEQLDSARSLHHSQSSRQPELEEDSLYDAWEAWSTIQGICSYSHKLSVALEIPRHLPPSRLQSRWFSEPVRFLFLPSKSFLRNAKGYPVLSKPTQQLLSRFARLRFPPWIALSDIGPLADDDLDSSEGDSSEPTPAEASSKAKEKPKDPTPHLQYLRHLQQTQPTRPPIERFGQGYQDYLQSPLQPLTDNLESITYEVFEKDPVKYEWYEHAIIAALKDLASLTDGRDIVVAVVGAGRGPLVTRALQASQKTGIRIKCWAVEKNPNAFVLLQRRNTTDPLWNGKVNVVKSDMRHWTGPVISGATTKVDIMVSELLGSFGDNELSPECLDGVQHVLHPDHGVNVPQSYSAHVTPIASPKIYGDLLSRQGAEKWELPYVVMLQQYDFLCTQGESEDVQLPDVQETWSFSHPVSPAIIEHSLLRAGGSIDSGGWVGGNGSNEHNSRACTLRFNARDQGVCHGLAGYFETVLYAGQSGKIELSTNPLTMDEKSKDMISWFPIFFPLKTPLYIPQDSVLELHMWRQTDDRSVWYEWIIDVFVDVDAETGRRRRLGMSELHSSRKNGCVM